MKKNDGDFNNGIGNNRNRSNRALALVAVDKHKEILEKQIQDRVACGWAWMKKGQTTKQVHPDKIENLIFEGWQKMTK